MQHRVLRQEAVGIGQGGGSLRLEQGRVHVSDPQGEPQPERIGELDPFDGIAVEHAVEARKRREDGGRRFGQEVDRIAQFLEHLRVHLRLRVVRDGQGAAGEGAVRDGTVGVRHPVQDRHLEDVGQGRHFGIIGPDGVQVDPRSDGAGEGVVEHRLGPAVRIQVIDIVLGETVVGSALVVGENVPVEALGHLVVGAAVLAVVAVLVGRDDVGHHLGERRAHPETVMVQHFIRSLLGIGIAVREVAHAGNQAQAQDRHKQRSQYLIHSHRHLSR